MASNTFLSPLKVLYFIFKSLNSLGPDYLKIHFSPWTSPVIGGWGPEEEDLLWMSPLLTICWMATMRGGGVSLVVSGQLWAAAARCTCLHPLFSLPCTKEFESSSVFGLPCHPKQQSLNSKEDPKFNFNLGSIPESKRKLVLPCSPVVVNLDDMQSGDWKGPLNPGSRREEGEANMSERTSHWALMHCNLNIVTIVLSEPAQTQENFCIYLLLSLLTCSYKVSSRVLSWINSCYFLCTIVLWFFFPNSVSCLKIKSNCVGHMEPL